MATSISVKRASGYPTETSMRVLVSFTVTYAANYDTEFEVHRGSQSGTIVQTVYGNSYYVGANGSKRDLPKTIYDLSPSTRYTLVVYLRNADTGNRLNVSPAVLSFTTESKPRPRNWYWSERVTFGGVTHNVPIVPGGTVPTVRQSNGDYYAYYMGASEWTNFVARVNEFRTYMNMNPVYLSVPARAGYPMSAQTINPIITAINDMTDWHISLVSRGTDISASLFLTMSSALNGIG